MEIRALKRDGRFVVIAATACILRYGAHSCGGGGSTVVPVSTAGFSISSTAITFGTQAVGTTSASQSATLINVGNASLTFTSIEVTGANAGDFQSEQYLRRFSGAVQGQCTVGLTFTPSAKPETGRPPWCSPITPRVAPQDCQCQWIGYFGDSRRFLQSANLRYPVVGHERNATDGYGHQQRQRGAEFHRNCSDRRANLGDFPETTTCGSSLAAAASCTIGVTFTPVAIGSRSAAVTIADNAAGSPQTISLTGTGTNPVASLSSNALDIR